LLKTRSVALPTVPRIGDARPTAAAAAVAAALAAANGDGDRDRDLLIVPLPVRLAAWLPARLAAWLPARLAARLNGCGWKWCKPAILMPGGEVEGDA
jgi:hypothetical protein